MYRVSDPKFAQASIQLVWAKNVTSALSKQLAWRKRIQEPKNQREMQKKKEKRKNGAKALQSCDRGSLPSSFLLSQKKKNSSALKGN
ncbi:hypothetical protein HKD37_20G056473 [Glycine soja]